MEERFIRNVPAISEAEQACLARKCAAVAGCGGLGGYLVEYLARLGVGKLIVIDGDSFERSNMNRQLLCTERTLGCGKAEAAAQRIREIRPETEVLCCAENLTAENADRLLSGADLVLDALDSAQARCVLADACGRLSLPLIHGAIQGWNAQIAVCMPGDGSMQRLYGEASPAPDKSCLSFTPALCAAMQTAEALRLLLGKESALQSRLLLADLRYMEFETLPL